MVETQTVAASRRANGRFQIESILRIEATGLLQHESGYLMVYSTGSHTGFYHRYHVVWSTRCRYKVLEGAIRELIREETFSGADFILQQDGACRLAPELAGRVVHEVSLQLRTAD